MSQTLQREMTTKDDIALRDILITCDGRGKEAKETALNELIERAVLASHPPRPSWHMEGWRL